ncbi:site-specific tyrosine recombinase XerC [Lignipirellula cremea]|uniref:Site-specific tyrosine recombinase XerC n=2 Tax=Lignipirellula cremea TaxID=2528010 RepID=A0A518E3U0_9BACT|nr:site-specific tyrosine recombinase XerC [Lignipirellula cremea]
MGKRSSRAAGKTGRTAAGHVRDVKIDRVGPVTIYLRGDAYYLYYMEDGQRKRPRIDGNLAVAKATAADVAKALAEERASPLTFQRTSPDDLVASYLTYVEEVQRRAWRTRQRYRAGLERFLDYARDRSIEAIDRITVSDVEDFVRWLRGKSRCRNGAKNGKKEGYKVGGIKFVLSTCRTAFNWAGRNRRLPPYAENPFSQFPADVLSEGDGEASEREVFTPLQEKAFFGACNEWQRSLFVTLAAYGMRVGELTHLLIENVDFDQGVLRIRSKPELLWQIKTRDRRDLPLTGLLADLLRDLIDQRPAGFVFLHEPFFAMRKQPAQAFANDSKFRQRLLRLAADMPDATEAERRRAVTAFCRSMGQIPLKRPRMEVMKLTEKIGCPEFTRAHDLRHLFSTRSQDAGGNPLLIQQITGHRSAAMLAHYTHFDIDAKRAALETFHARFTEPEETDE